MLCAVAVFAVMDGLLKLMAQYYPPMQVATLRGITSLPFMLVPLLVMRRLRDLRPRRFGMHLLRGALMMAVLGGFIYAVKVLSLANAYAIFMSAPLLVTALSAPLLGDRTEWQRWLAIGVGLIGVVIVLHPSASSLISLGAAAALFAALGYALNAIALRVLTRTDTTSAVVFWTVGLMSLFAALLALPGWVPLQREHWKWLLGIGACGAIAQHLLTEAFRSAPPSVVAPFEYTALLWGAVIDWTVWHVLPTQRIYVGGSIVIASGLYLLWRERTLSTQLQRA
jgi:drug/metabolite transporter (DMT)-like permease